MSRFTSLAEKAQNLEGFQRTLESVSQLGWYKVQMDVLTSQVEASVNGGAWFPIFGAFGPVVNLQQAYDGGAAPGTGAGRLIANMAGGPVILQQSLANTALDIDYRFTGGTALTVKDTNLVAPTVLTSALTGIGVDLSSAQHGNQVVQGMQVTGPATAAAAGPKAGTINVLARHSAMRGISLTVRNKRAGTDGLAYIEWDRDLNFEGAAGPHVLTNETNMLVLDGAGTAPCTVDAVTNNALFRGLWVKVPATTAIGRGTAIRIEGDPTSCGYESDDGQTFPVSAVGEGRIRYNNATAAWEASISGGAYIAFAPLVVTLQAAYNGGAGIVVTGTNPVTIANVAAVTSSLLGLTDATQASHNTYGLTYSRTTAAPTGGSTYNGGAISITNTPGNVAYNESSPGLISITHTSGALATDTTTGIRVSMSPGAAGAVTHGINVSISPGAAGAVTNGISVTLGANANGIGLSVAATATAIYTNDLVVVQRNGNVAGGGTENGPLIDIIYNPTFTATATANKNQWRVYHAPVSSGAGTTLTLNGSLARITHQWSLAAGGAVSDSTTGLDINFAPGAANTATLGIAAQKNTHVQTYTGSTSFNTGAASTFASPTGFVQIKEAITWTPGAARTLTLSRPVLDIQHGHTTGNASATILDSTPIVNINHAPPAQSGTYTDTTTGLSITMTPASSAAVKGVDITMGPNCSETNRNAGAITITDNSTIATAIQTSYALGINVTANTSRGAIYAFNTTAGAASASANVTMVHFADGITLASGRVAGCSGTRQLYLLELARLNQFSGSGGYGTSLAKITNSPEVTNGGATLTLNQSLVEIVHLPIATAGSITDTTTGLSITMTPASAAAVKGINVVMSANCNASAYAATFDWRGVAGMPAAGAVRIATNISGNFGGGASLGIGFDTATTTLTGQWNGLIIDGVTNCAGGGVTNRPITVYCSSNSAAATSWGVYVDFRSSNGLSVYGLNHSTVNISGNLAAFTFHKMDFGTATTTLTGALTGLNIDLSTNVTPGAQNVTGAILKIPATTAADADGQGGLVVQTTSTAARGASIEKTAATSLGRALVVRHEGTTAGTGNVALRLTGAATSTILEMSNGGPDAVAKRSNANEGRIIYDSATQSFMASVNGGVYAAFAPAPVVTLQAAYNGGAGIVVTASNPVTITNTAIVTSSLLGLTDANEGVNNTYGLTYSRTAVPAGQFAGGAISIVNTPGDAAYNEASPGLISITHTSGASATDTTTCFAMTATPGATAAVSGILCTMGSNATGPALGIVHNGARNTDIVTIRGAGIPAVLSTADWAGLHVDLGIDTNDPNGQTVTGIIVDFQTNLSSVSPNTNRGILVRRATAPLPSFVPVNQDWRGISVTSEPNYNLGFFSDTGVLLSLLHAPTDIGGVGLVADHTLGISVRLMPVATGTPDVRGLLVMMGANTSSVGYAATFDWQGTAGATAAVFETVNINGNLGAFTFHKIDFGTATTTLTGALTGLELDLSTNLVGGGQAISGLKVVVGNSTAVAPTSASYCATFDYRAPTGTAVNNGIVNIEVGAPTTLTGQLVGLELDLKTNVTPGTQVVAGINMTIPSNAGANASKGFSYTRSGAATATGTYSGNAINVQNTPTGGGGGVTLTESGVLVNVNHAPVAGATAIVDNTVAYQATLTPAAGNTATLGIAAQKNTHIQTYTGSTSFNTGAASTFATPTGFVQIKEAITWTPGAARTLTLSRPVLDIQHGHTTGNASATILDSTPIVNINHAPPAQSGTLTDSAVGLAITMTPASAAAVVGETITMGGNSTYGRGFYLSSASTYSATEWYLSHINMSGAAVGGGHLLLTQTSATPAAGGFNMLGVNDGFSFTPGAGFATVNRSGAFNNRCALFRRAGTFTANGSYPLSMVMVYDQPISSGGATTLTLNQPLIEILHVPTAAAGGSITDTTTGLSITMTPASAAAVKGLDVVMSANCNASAYAATFDWRGTAGATAAVFETVNINGNLAAFTFHKMNFGTATTTLTGALTGLNIDLSTNVTPGAQNVNGIVVTIPATTRAEAVAEAALVISSTATKMRMIDCLVHNTEAATGLWVLRYDNAVAQTNPVEGIYVDLATAAPGIHAQIGQEIAIGASSSANSRGLIITSTQTAGYGANILMQPAGACGVSSLLLEHTDLAQGPCLVVTDNSIVADLTASIAITQAPGAGASTDRYGLNVVFSPAWTDNAAKNTGSLHSAFTRVADIPAWAPGGGVNRLLTIRRDSLYVVAAPAANNANAQLDVADLIVAHFAYAPTVGGGGDITAGGALGLLVELSPPAGVTKSQGTGAEIRIGANATGSLGLKISNAANTDTNPMFALQSKNAGSYQDFYVNDGAPAFAAVDGSVCFNRTGGVGTSIYKRIAAAWQAIA